MEPTVLVTAIGTAASTAIVLQLKAAGGFHIIGADIYKDNQIATAKDVDEFYRFPSAVDDLNAYIDFAVDFCEIHSVDFYFATIDEEIANLSINRKRFDAIGVKLCIPNHGLVMTCHYKNRFSDWILNNIPEIYIIRYEKFSEIKDEEFPVFIKPVEGRASLGCRKIENSEELDNLKSEGINEKDFIIQQFIDGEIITVDMIRNSQNRHSEQIQRIEELRNPSGCGIAVKIIDDPKLAEICEQLMEKLDLNGVINAEFFRKDDHYQIIEINPRFAAGTSFSCAVGCNTVMAALDIAKGKDFVLDEPIIGIHLAKRYETYCME